MTWIKSPLRLGHDPRTRRTARALGIGTREKVGLLHMLWWWATEYSPGTQGDLATWPVEDIADAVDWPAEGADALVAALQAGGFLEGLQLVDWDEVAGALIKRRAEDAERKRGARSRPADIQRTGDGLPVGEARPSSVEKIRSEKTRQEREYKTRAAAEETRPSAAAPVLVSSSAAAAASHTEPAALLKADRVESNRQAWARRNDVAPMSRRRAQ